MGIHGTRGVTPGLIVRAAASFRDPNCMVGTLPYGEPAFDDALRSAEIEAEVFLGRGYPTFAAAMVDAAGSMKARVVREGGPVKDVEARLFALKVSWALRDVTALCTPAGMRGLGEMLRARGLAAAGSRISFAPKSMPCSALATLTPGAARRLTHLLAARGTPGFPTPMVHDVRTIFGHEARDEHPVAGDGALVDRVVIGVRLSGTRPGRAAPVDWFTHLGDDPEGIGSEAHIGWEVDVAGRFGGDLDVSVPVPVSAVGMEASAASALVAFSREARLRNVGDVFANGVLHRFRDGHEVILALSLLDGRVLGPVRAPRHLALAGMTAIRSGLGIAFEEVEHSDPLVFSRVLTRDAIHAGSQPLTGPLNEWAPEEECDSDLDLDDVSAPEGTALH